MRRLGTWLRRVALGVLALVALVVFVCAAMFTVPALRSYAVQKALGAANEALPFKIAIEQVERLDPWGLSLRNIQLRDAQGTEMARLAYLSAGLLPLELLEGKVRVTHVALSGMRGTIDPKKLAGPEEPEEPESAPSDLTIQVDALRISDVDVHVPLAERDMRFVVAKLAASGTWAPMPALVLSHATLRVEADEKPVLSLFTSHGNFALDKGGVVELRGHVAGAALHLNAKLPALDGPRTWPFEALTLSLDNITRRGLADLGVADGAGLVSRVDVRLEAQVTGDLLELEGRVRAGQSVLELKGHADADKAQLTALLGETVLASVVESLPALRVQGGLDLAYAYKASPPVLDASWRAVRIDANALPDGSLRAELPLPVVRLTSLTLVGFEQALSLRGELDTAQTSGSVHLDTRELELGDIAPLRAAGLTGVVNGGLRARIERGETLAGQGKIELTRVGVSDTRVGRVELEFDARGRLEQPSGNLSLRVEDLVSGEQRVNRASAVLNVTDKGLRAQLSAQGNETSFDAQLRGTHGPSSIELTGSGSGQVLGRTLRFQLVDLRYADQAASLTGLDVRYGAERLSVSGALTKSERVTGKLELANVELASWADLIGMPGLSGAVHATVSAEGKLAQPKVAAKLSVAKLHLPDQPALDVHVDAGADLAVGELTGQVDVVSLEAPLEAHATIGVKLPRRRTDLARAFREAELSAEIEGKGPLALATRYAGEEFASIDGVVQTRVQAHGTLDVPEVNASLDIALSDPEPKKPGRERLHVTLHVDRADGVVEVDMSDHAGELLEARAALRWPLGSLRAALENREAFRVLPLAEANVRLFERRLDKFEGVIGKLASHYGAALPVRVGAEVSLRGEGQTFDATVHAQATAVGSELDVRCAKQSDLHLGLDARITHERLSVALTTQAGGLGRATVQVMGDVKAQPLLAGDLTGLYPLELRAHGEKLEVNRLPGLCELQAGTLAFDIGVTGVGAAPPRLDAAITLDQVRAGEGVPISAKLFAQADETSARVEGKIETAGAKPGTLSAAVPLSYKGPFAPELVRDKPIRASFRVQGLPIASAVSFSPALGQPEGTVSVDLSVAGTVETPKPRGYVELSDVAFSLASLAQPFHDVSGRIEIDDRTLRVKKLVASDRGGKLRADGQLQLRADGTAEGEIVVKADQFPLRQQGTIVGELSIEAALKAKLLESSELDLALELREGRLWLTGDRGRDVQSLDAHPHVRFSDQPAEPVVVAAKDPGVTLRTLTFKSVRDLWLLHKDFSVQVGVDAKLESVRGVPTLTGEALLRRGDLKLLGKTFSIERGTIRFTGDNPPDPALDLKAKFDPPSGEALFVQVSGRASAPELTFSGAASNAGEAVAVMSGVGGAGAETKAQDDAKNFAVGVTAGLLTMTARREFGDWVPMLSVETDESGAVNQARAGFDATDLIPPFLERVARGAYVEGVVGSDAQSSSVGLGVRLEVALPRDFVTSMGYGPGPAWSFDAAWAP